MNAGDTEPVIDVHIWHCPTCNQIADTKHPSVSVCKWNRTENINFCQFLFMFYNFWGFQCHYCSNPIHLDKACMPAQLNGSEHVGQCCLTCLTDVCDQCSLLKMEEHDLHCTCKQQSRQLSDETVRQSLCHLLTVDNLKRLLYRCNTFKSTQNNNLLSISQKKKRSHSRPQLVLPDYSTVTISEARTCILAEVTALFSAHCARSDTLVYSHEVPLSANDYRLNNSSVQVK